MTKKTLEGLRKAFIRYDEEILGGKKKADKEADKKKAKDLSLVQTLPEVAKRSVSLDFLLRFTESNDCWAWSTEDVVKKVIKPATAKFECAFCELPAMGVQAIYENEVGPPRVFVSHAWQNSWGLMVSALLDLTARHGKETSFTCWIDCFAINQHLDTTNKLEELEQTVAVSSNFLQICDAKTLPFRRAWPIYEVPPQAVAHTALMHTRTHAHTHTHTPLPHLTHTHTPPPARHSTGVVALCRTSRMHMAQSLTAPVPRCLQGDHVPPPTSAGLLTLTCSGPRWIHLLDNSPSTCR